MKRALALLLSAVLLLGILNGVAAAEPAEEESAPSSAAAETPVDGRTTLMIYMIGADLEQDGSAVTKDLQEITDSSVDLETTQILVCAGGTQQWHNELMDTGSETILLLTAEGFEKLEHLPLQSMGKPACLAAFLNFCVENYPAEHYALILWDHGKGPVEGYGSDFLFDEDGLTLLEMRQAMEQTPFAGELRLDWVGFDACLMASAELACVWQDYADYLISSQDWEPAFGWNYAFLDFCGRVSTPELCRRVADSYLAYAEEYNAKVNALFREDVAMSVLDLSRAGDLKAAIEALFCIAADDVSGDYVPLARARVGARAFTMAAANAGYDLVDLQTVAENLSEAYPKESAALLVVLEDMVVCSVSNTPLCCGMSLYYPFYNKAKYQERWKESYRELAVFPAYLDYLSRFEQIWLGSDMQRFFSGGMEVREGALPSTYTLQLSPEQAAVYAQSNYYILRRYSEELYSLVYCSDEVTMEDGLLSAVFDGNVIYFGSDYAPRGIPVTRMWNTVDDVTTYTALGIQLVHGSILEDDYATLSVEIRFSVDRRTGELQVKGIYPSESGDGLSGGKQEAIDLSDWDRIDFYNLPPSYLVRDENGNLLSFWDWPESGLYTGRALPVADNPHFSYEPLYDDGSEYYILINVSDVQGNSYCSELFPIQLAQAPEEEEQQAEELVWDEGDSCTLLDLGQVQFGITAVRDFASGTPAYYLTGSNLSGRPVRIDFSEKSFLINDTYTIGLIGDFYLDVGETGRCLLRELTSSVLLSSEERLTSLACDYTVKYDDDSSTLAKGRLRLIVTAEPEPALHWDSFLDARAEEQPLLNADGLSVSLLGLGTPWGSSLPLAALRVDNRSGSDKELTIWGLCFNGILFSSGKSLTLEDGKLWYPILTLSEHSIRSLDYFGQYWLDEDLDALPCLSSIAGASLFLGIDGELYACPIVLAEQGEQASPEPEGELLYQDELMEVLLYRHCQVPWEDWEEEKESQAEIWYLWIINRSDHVIYPAVSRSIRRSNPYPCGWSPIEPGGKCFCSYPVPTQEGQSYSLILHVDDYDTQPIELPLD